MSMNSWLEIIVPVGKPDEGLAQTVASLTSQTDRSFGVLLNGNADHAVCSGVDEAGAQLTQAGIAVRRVNPPFEMGRIEGWNWAHAQAQAEWLKLLLPGERLKTEYVERLKRRIAERPNAAVIRCDAAVETEWGEVILKAPFAGDAISATGFLDHFPKQVDWIARSVNLAYRRAAWRASGGYAVHLPQNSALNLNVILALHHGLENIGEPLAGFDMPKPGQGVKTNRVSSFAELWLILRQTQNYCLATKLPWTKRGVIAPALAAALRRS
jgi:hypothetical protein